MPRRSPILPDIIHLGPNLSATIRELLVFDFNLDDVKKVMFYIPSNKVDWDIVGEEMVYAIPDVLRTCFVVKALNITLSL